jgi:hypothetical protein
MGGSQYASGLNSMNCNNDSMFSLQGNLFIPSSIKPITLGNLSSSYDDIKVLYIPTLYLNAIGAKLGIYPDGLLEFFDNLIHERKLSLFPISWLTANERRKALVAPYALGQTVYSQKLEKSFISLIPDNIEEPSNTKAWKEINYKNPSSTELIPESISNPVDELLALFG